MLNFRKFCEENKDATTFHIAKPNTGYSDARNLTFEQVVNPLIKEFVRRIVTETIGEHVLQLQPAQIEYIIQEVKKGLEQARYNPQDDLGSIINNLWRKGNSGSKTPNHTNTPFDR